MPRRPPANRAWKVRARRPARFAAVPKARAGSRAARRGRWRTPSAECRDLREEIGLIHGLHDVIARALPHAPDPVGLLALARAQDHRDAFRGFVARERARRLEAVLS